MYLIFYTLSMLMIIMSYFMPNLFFLWMFLEITSLSFIVLLNLYSLKTYSISYFLTSNISSILILFSFINSDSLLITNTSLLFGLWLKLGNYPLNSWVNFLMKEINYNCLIPLLTIMKIIPMLIFIKFIKINTMLLYLMVMSSLVSTILSLSTSSYPLLMNFSSMYNIPLMLILFHLNLNMTYFFMSTYLASTLLILNTLKFLGVYYKNSLNLNLFPYKKSLLNFSLIMYAQLPPFSLFMMKWSLIEYLMEDSPLFMLIAMMIILASLLMTFNYLNFNNYTYFLTNFKINHKIYNNNKNNYFMMSLLLYISFFLIFLYPYID